MKPSEYLKPMSQEERASFAKRIGTTLGYLNLIRGGHRRLGPSLAKKFVSAAGGKVSLEEIRPDIWGEDPLPATNSIMEARLDLVNQ